MSQQNSQNPNLNQEIQPNQIESNNQTSSMGVQSLGTSSQPRPHTSQSAPQLGQIQTPSENLPNLNQLGTLREIVELLDYVKQMKEGTQSNRSQEETTPASLGASKQVPTLNLPNTTIPTPVYKPTIPLPQDITPQENLLVPQLTLDEYKGKTHIFDFLQYLCRQKSVLQNIKISEIQKKCLLNNKLPSYVANNMVYAVNDININLDQYISQVQEYYGPKREQVRQQLMAQNLFKYDNYITFVHKMYQYSLFAGITQQNLLFILEQKLPEHVTQNIGQCVTIEQYIQQLKSLQKEGWFGPFEKQFRKTLTISQNYQNQEGKRSDKNQTQTSEQSQKQGQDHKFGSSSQNTTFQSNVAFIEFENQNCDIYDSFPVDSYPVQTRGVKRQHIDTKTKTNEKFQVQAQQQQQEFIRQQQQKQQQQQQQQNLEQQQAQQNLQNSQGTSKIANQAKLQDESLKKLLERAKQNAQINAQNSGVNKTYDFKNISKGIRNRKFPVENVQEPNRPGYLQLDPYKYVNQNQQTNLTQIFNDVCIPVTLKNFLQMNGFEVTKKQDQNIVPNLAYFGEVAENNHEIIPQFTSKSVQFAQDLQQESTLEDDTQLYNYFYNQELQHQLQKNNILDAFQSVTQNSEGQQQMCVLLTINDKSVVGVVDGGASKTILSKQVVEQAGISDQVTQLPKTGNGIYVSGVSGTERIFGIIPRLSVTLQGYQVDFADVLVQQSANFDLLIGLDVLSLFDFKVGMKNREISFIPYPDDPRVILQLCSKQGQAQNLFKAHLSYVTVQDIDFMQYTYQISQIYPDFPISKRYQLIYMDPPWLYEKPMYKTKPKYPCLSEKQLCLLPIQVIAEENCILLLWSTGSHLPQAIKLLNFWKFKYINFFLVWKKINKLNKKAVYGHGHYSKNCFEVLLIATKGKVASLRRHQRFSVSQELELGVTELQEPRSNYFSRKPSTVYDYIQKIFKVERLNCIEIFATQRTQHNQMYDLYGNTLSPKFQKQTFFQKHTDVTYSTFIAPTTLQVNTIQNDFQNKIVNYCQTLNVPNELSNENLFCLQTLIKKFHNIFKFDNQLSYTNLGEADINLKPFSKPVRMKPYRIVGEPYDFLKQKFQELEQQGLVSKGQSEWATAVMVVPKEGSSEKYRAVQNFKKVNQLTKKDKYPLRLIQHILLKLKDKKYFCVLDLKGGFNQIKRSIHSKKILAMILPFGLYIPEVMFFGETNAPSIFQRYMDLAIGDLYGQGVECYIDDIILYANSMEEMLQLLEKLFLRLQRANFKLNPEKCQYFVQKATILGHEVQGNSVSPKQKKVDKLLLLEAPKTKKQLQQYMGSINYYRKFLPELSTLFIPFQQSLSSQSNTLVWKESQIKSFEIIQTFLKQKLVLKIPDLQKPFKVVLSHTQNTYAAALLQNDQKGEYVVGFHSQVQILTRNKIIPYIREIDCLVWALNEWRPYIQHQSFIVETDQNALKFLYENKTHNLQLINYQLELQDLIFEIQPIKNNRVKQMLLLTNLKNNNIFLNSTIDTIQNLQCLPSSQQTDSNQRKRLLSGSSFAKFQYIMQFDGASQKLQFNTQVRAGAFVIFDKNKNILFKNQFDFPSAQKKQLCGILSTYSRVIIFDKSKTEQTTYTNIGRFPTRNQITQLSIYVQFRKPCYTLQLSQRSFKIIFLSQIEHIDRQHNFECDKLAKNQLAKLSQKLLTKNVIYQQDFAELGVELDLIKCKICDSEEPQETMLFCDNCNNTYHIDCLDLSDIPTGDWYCKTCLQEIYQKLQNGTYVDPTQDLVLLDFLKYDINLLFFDSSTRNRVLQRSRIYILLNEILYKVSPNNLREVPTVGERNVLIEQVHQLVGHLGQNRTTSLIKQYYYWPNMQYNIENILRQCLLCQAQNPNFLKMPGVFPISKNFKPMQVLYLDCFYLPKSKLGNSLVVLSVCGTSKWVEGRPLKTNNSSYIRDFLFDQIICRYGTPQVIRSDNGPEFRGELSALCERLGIIQIFSSPYYPQTNGQIERFNRTVKNCMIKLFNSYNSVDYSWEELLPQVLMGINFTKSRSSKFSAFQTLFGADPVLPGYQGVQKNITLSFPNDQEQENYVLNKIAQKDFLHSQIAKNLQDFEKEIEDVVLRRQKISNVSLEYGHLVFLKREDSKYPFTKTKGPYIFLGYNDAEKTSAMVINPINQKVVIVNVTKISPIRLY